MLTKYAWAIPLKKNSGLSITNGFKIVLSEHRKPEKLWVDRGSEFYNKTFQSLLNPMFINGDGNWVNILNDAVITYNNNIHSTINMTPVDASNKPDKVRYIISTSTKIEPKFKVSDYVRKADKRNIFSKGYTSNWNRELFKFNEV